MFRTGYPTCLTLTLVDLARSMASSIRSAWKTVETSQAPGRDRSPRGSTNCTTCRSIDLAASGGATYTHPFRPVRRGVATRGGRTPLPGGRLRLPGHHRSLPTRVRIPVDRHPRAAETRIHHDPWRRAARSSHRVLHQVAHHRGRTAARIRTPRPRRKRPGAGPPGPRRGGVYRHGPPCGVPAHPP